MTTGGGGAHTYTHIYTHRRKTGHYHQLIKKNWTPRTGRKKWGKEDVWSAYHTHSLTED